MALRWKKHVEKEGIEGPSEVLNMLEGDMTLVAGAGDSSGDVTDLKTLGVPLEAHVSINVTSRSALSGQLDAAIADSLAPGNPRILSVSSSEAAETSTLRYLIIW